MVDSLLAERHGRPPPRTPPPSAPPRLPAVLRGYQPADYDEVVALGGRVLPRYGWLFRALDGIGLDAPTMRETDRHAEQRSRGVTFPVSDDSQDRLFPLDLLPRLVTASDLRVPSGIGYAITRPELLDKALLAATPPKADGDGALAVLTGARPTRRSRRWASRCAPRSPTARRAWATTRRSTPTCRR